MKKTEVLILCTHQKILDTIIRLVSNSGEMNGTAAGTSAEVLALFHSQPFDIVLIGAGLAPEAEQLLVAELYKSKPEIPVIYHYGGGSGLLFTEIKQALNKC